MSPFQWLREQVAQAVVAGWEDGWAKIEQDVPRVAKDTSVGGKKSGAIDSASPVVASASAAPPGPLAGIVDRLRLASSASDESAPSAASTSAPRKPPRKHP